jgi:RNA polymerase sigma-54 factor
MTELRVEARVEVSATVVLAATMLAMPSHELRETLLVEQERNPALLVRRRQLCHRCHRALVSGGCPRCGHAAAREVGDPVATTSSWEHLRQDAVAAAPRELVEPVLVVLAAVDDRGLLPQQARENLLSGKLTRHVLTEVLAILRAAGPPGIAAATPAESLLLQLESGPFDAAEASLARRLLSVHADSLADGDLVGIAAIEGCGVDVVERLITRMRRLLRPYPGFGEPAVPRVSPPDLSFEFTGSRVRALVVEREVFDLSVEPGYGQVSEARSLIGGVHRRWSMLQRLGNLLAAHHGERLRDGSSGFRPLTRVQAAERIGVHESTVSRAVAHRCAALANGEIVALSAMFGSKQDSYAAVAELCGARPRPPDSEVVRVLAERGITLSRRTVAKYRHALGL